MQKIQKRVGVLMCCLCLVGQGLLYAEEKTDDGQGPGTVVLRSVLDAETPARPAHFPHQTHQWLECVTCHHDVSKAGTLVPLVAGNKVLSCEGCHNSTAEETIPWRLGTFKRVGHYFCMECHLTNATQAARCGACHVQQQ